MEECGQTIDMNPDPNDTEAIGCYQGTDRYKGHAGSQRNMPKLRGI